MKIAETQAKNRQNLVNFRNEVSVIGQGMRDENSFFGKLPPEMTREVISTLVTSHDLFAPRLEKDIERNLYREPTPADNTCVLI